MNWLNQINESLIFIEKHITDDITCEDVAKKAFSSYHHYMRMFFLLSGVNLGEYILTLEHKTTIKDEKRLIYQHFLIFFQFFCIQYLY